MGKGMNYYMQTYNSPVGQLYLVEGDKKLRAVSFARNWQDVRRNFPHVEIKNTTLLRSAKRQLREYFRGDRRSFDLPYEVNGTEFQTRVWRALTKIPYGQTRTYKQQAMAVGSPNASRAIGRAEGQNPICIVLPCHRVIGSNGRLTGFGGGMEAKKYLLSLEGKAFPGKRV
jgi:methylated-DNA-[protein]-cysteine S-methyltransferase